MADYEIEVSIPNTGPVGPQGPPGEFGDLEAPEDGIIYGRKDAEWVDMTAPANLQVRRGTAAEVAAITPLEGEPVWATDTKKLFVGDGSSSGGIRINEITMEPSLAVGFVPGKIRASDALNGIGAAFGTPQVLGNSRATGTVDLQMSRTSATQIASGSNSFIAAGRNNTASGNFSAVVGGEGCSATGNYSVASGLNASAGAGSLAHSATALGTNSAAFCSNATASAEATIAFSAGTADRRGMLAIGSPGISNFTGRGQSVQLQMRGYTTNATPTEMVVASGPIKLTIPENVALFGTIEIAAIQVTTPTETAHYVRKFAIQNLGGTTTLIGSVTTVGTDHETTAGMDVAITADDTGDFLKVEVTGIASTNLRWMACVRGVEIAIT
jgi:hypothetical protein